MEADCLSRNPVLEAFDNEDELRIVNFIELESIKNSHKDLNREKYVDKNGIAYIRTRHNQEKILISVSDEKSFVSFFLNLYSYPDYIPYCRMFYF